jgi:hypothetical protein
VLVELFLSNVNVDIGLEQREDVDGMGIENSLNVIMNEIEFC